MTVSEEIKIPDWNTRYSESEEDYIFGQEPSELGRLTMHFWKMFRKDSRGKVLDLGCGEGRDAALFSREGFRVTAVDRAEAGIQKAIRLANQNGHPLEEAVCADIRDFSLNQSYDLIFAGNSLQALGDYFPSYLKCLQEITAPGGFHAVRAHAAGSDYLKRGQGMYILDHNELKFRYEGWRLFYYSEDLLYTPFSGDMVSFAGIIAQKPEA
jgi:tellurite methyltransferase